ncbi:MAG: hypothetical protein WBJ54_08150 [Syntrophorhabdus sp.]|jgi:phosphoglycerate-specific signal transduction histidine kinase|nr:hypothetical protein [Syntrophorhabdus sp.]MDI9560490.1 hypothetical protein [Pseudomonadota bacterium]OQB67475.1 MAG: hypothetical protein BWX92_04004 [Deltaproteobacteria bacterium ADurb.Bin135]MBP8743482.1 hypothetical protein [Syntrophorhabdus sp.]HNS79793.1 hypothetical protein [Syntrophorhabdus sp.]
MNGVTLNRIIDDFNELSFEDKEYAIELIQKQLIEAKRERIVRRSKEVETNLRKGKVKRGTMEDLLKDLEND